MKFKLKYSSPDIFYLKYSELHLRLIFERTYIFYHLVKVLFSLLVTSSYYSKIFARLKVRRAWEGK